MNIKHLSTLIFAGSLAALMSSTVVHADTASYNQLKDSVSSRLSGLGVDTSDLGKLSTMQLAELTSTLDHMESDDLRAMSADFMISEFLHPTDMSLDSADGKALAAKLAAKLKEINVPYPTAALTTTQVQALLATLSSKTHYHTDAKQAVDAIVAMAMRPMTIDESNAGVLQQEAQVYTKLNQFGITPPPKGSLTFEQLGKLEGIISTSDTEAQMKSDAMQVLASK